MNKANIAAATPGDLERAAQDKMIEDNLFPVVDAGVIPILLGGDHSVTLPELRVMARKHGPIALIHFDSHTDTGDKRFGRKYTMERPSGGRWRRS